MKRRKPAFRVRLDQRRAWARMNVLNLTRNDLARLIGRTSGYVSQMLNGERCPAPETRKRLMTALEVSRFEELFIMEENVD